MLGGALRGGCSQSYDRKRSQRGQKIDACPIPHYLLPREADRPDALIHGEGEDMEIFRTRGVGIEYELAGTGEPILLIHGGLLADALLPLLQVKQFTDRFRIIHYHRFGYGKSTHGSNPVSIAVQAAQAQALLKHLGIGRAHVAGYSYGGIIALQMALDFPPAVASLALLEPALVAPSEARSLGRLVRALKTYRAGDKTATVDFFLGTMLGPDYRRIVECALPPGALTMAVADLHTMFAVEPLARVNWKFTAREAAKIRVPVLSIVGVDSAPIYHERHQMVLRFFPQAEALTIPRAAHGLQMMNPGAVAEGLASFFSCPGKAI